METMPKSSFYKILMDLPPQLGLPQGFMEKYGEILPKKVKLRAASGATWEVRVEKLKDEDEYCYFFTRGWTKFSQDMGLQFAELLVFSYDGDSTFDVSVYATTTLEKVPEFPTSAENPLCLIPFKESYYYRFRIPAYFLGASGLKGKKKVVLEYVGGVSAQVRLTRSPDRVAFGAGWRGFSRANGMTVNKIYSFEFVPTRNVIRVWPYHQP